jgi:hypothetical protein
MAAELAQAGFLLGGVCRVGMAAIFAQSAWHALRAPSLHEAAVAGYDLLPHWAVPAAARGLPLLSAAAAVLLLWPVSAMTGSVLGLALLTVFTAAIAINLRRGRIEIDCGCGGAAGQMISPGLVARNLLLLCVLGTALALPVSGGLDAASVTVLLGGGGGIAALYFTASQLLANAAALRAGDARA